MQMNTQTISNKYVITEISNLKIEHDNEPYILIDMSGSTACSIRLRDKQQYDFKEPQSVLDMERALAYTTMKKMGVEKAHILFWDSHNKWIEIDGQSRADAVDISFLLTDKSNTGGSTYLCQALQSLSFETVKQINDVYIFTDGELNDPNSSLSKELQRLFQNNVNIHIYTVDNNDSDYLDADCNIGNKLFSSVRDMNMTSNIFEFVLHNERHGFDNGFQNFYNPNIPHDHVLFKQYILHKNDVAGLVKLLSGLNLPEMTNSEMKKIMYDLSKTVYKMTQNKSITLVNEIVSLICKAFDNTDVKDTIFDTLVNNTADIKAGNVQTYHEYRNAKVNRNEKAQLSIFDNVKKSISPIGSTFVSFPIKLNDGNEMLFTVDDKDVNENLSVRNKVFANGCFKFQGHNIPILPASTVNLSNPEVISCVRRWVFSVYFQLKPTCNSEDMVLYQFLIDMLCIYLSNVSDNIKQTYVELARVMLGEKRDNSDIAEYDFLLANKPALVYGGEKAYYNLMKRCKEINGISNVTTNTLWYGILIALNDDRLLAFHKQHVQTGLKYDSIRNIVNNAVNFNCNENSEILNYIKLHITKSYNTKQLNNVSNNLEYTCYITMDSTAESGGYKIKEHELAPNIVCRPRYVIKKEIFEAMEEEYKVCPICHADLSDPSDNMYIFVPPQKNEDVDENDKINDPIVDEPALKCNMHEVVSIPDDMTQSIDDVDLKEIDTLNFDTISYEFDKPTINDTLNSRRIAITKSADFKTMMGYRYPFIEKMSFKNLMIGGGFCRSILLKQKAKDIDFFFFSDDGDSQLKNNEDYVKCFRNALNELTTAIYEHYSEIDKNIEEKFGENAIKHNIKFMVMFKPLFNVFEVICIKDPKHFIDDEFSLKYFDKYKFNSMNPLNKHVQINAKDGVVTTDDKNFIDNELNSLTKDMLSNYFEDNDKSGVSMLHRFQFVLAKYNTKLDVLNNFDMYPSRLCYDGNKVYMTSKAHFAYKYMVNVLCEKGYSNMFDSRVSKYFSYGFSIVMPSLDIAKIPEPKNRIVLNDLKFNIHNICNNNITVEHDSNMEEKLKSNAKLERHCKEKGISLYKSAMFCSLVSVCRYVEANGLDYLFTNKPIDAIVDDNVEFKFHGRNLETNFVNWIVSRIYNYDWYGSLRKTNNVDTCTFADKIETALNAINKMPDSGKIVIYGSNKVSGYCNAFKVENGIAFVGPSSKMLAKLYMEKNPKYKWLTQELNAITGVRQFICRESFDKVNPEYAYEILLENKYYKPYLDIEWTFESQEELNSYDEVKFLAELRTDIVSVFKNRYDLDITREEILILSAHADNLKSYHVIVNAKEGKKKILFEKNQRNANNSAYSFCYYMMKKSPEYVDKLDWRVYTTDREFRMPFAFKSLSDKRQFTPIKYGEHGIADTKSYLVTSYNASKIKLIECDEIRSCEFIEKKNRQRKIKRTLPDSLPANKTD